MRTPVWTRSTRSCDSLIMVPVYHGTLIGASPLLEHARSWHPFFLLEEGAARLICRTLLMRKCPGDVENQELEVLPNVPEYKDPVQLRSTGDGRGGASGLAPV